MQYSWFSTKPARVNQSLHHVLLLAVDPVTQRHTQYAWRGRTLHPYIPYTRTAEWIPDRCKNPTMKLTIINSNTHNLQAWPFSPDYPAPGTALRTSQKTALNKVHVPVEMGIATMMAGLLSLHIHNHHRRHVFLPAPIIVLPVHLHVGQGRERQAKVSGSCAWRSFFNRRRRFSGPSSWPAPEWGKDASPCGESCKNNIPQAVWHCLEVLGVRVLWKAFRIGEEKN